MSQTNPDPADQWPVYVINMADNSARMAKVTAAMSDASVPFQRFEAVDGRALSEIQKRLVYDAAANKTQFRKPLLPGELGCYLSHIGLWQKVQNGSSGGAIILEDDFLPDPDFASVIAALSTDKTGWDMVKLYARRADSKVVHTQNLCPGFQLVIPYQIPNTTLGYAISKQGAQRLLAQYIPFARPIDEDLKRFWEHGLDIRLVVPPPLALSEQAQSGDTIQAARRAQKHQGVWGSIRQGLKNLRYRLTYLARLHFHRRIGR